MLKKTLFAMLLITGLAFVTTNVMAQCGPNELFIDNTSPCDKVVTIWYGDGPICNVVGSITVNVPAGTSTCVPIPVPSVPLKMLVVDVSTSNSTTVEHPGCGPNQQGMHMACEDMCNLIIFHPEWHLDILPD